MRHRIAHVLVFLACVIAGSATGRAQEVGIAAEVLTATVDAQPREAVSLQVRFTNVDTVWRTVASSLAVPAGWVVLVPPDEDALAPGESRVTLATVLVASDAAAGTYTFPMTYRTTAGSPSGEVSFTVRVPAIDRVVLTLVDAPAFVAAGEPHRVEFLLQNAGNTTHEWDLTSTSSAGLPVALTPGTATLAPGESTTVVAIVGASSRVAPQPTHALTVTVASRSLSDVRATARAVVPIIPTDLPAASALHSFPLTMSASYRGSTGTPGGPPPRLAIEWSGRGTISDRDPGTLDVRLRVTSAKLVEHVVLEYQRPTWGVRFGHQTVAPSPLSSSVAGFGVRASATWSLGAIDRLDTELTAYGFDGEARFAAAATAALPHGANLGATLAGDRTGLLGTVEMRYAPERRDASAVQITAFGATYGLRIAGDVGFAQALRIAVQANAGPSFVRLTYDAAAAAFDDREQHQASLRIAGTLRLNEAFSVQARFPLDLTFGYDRTWGWDDDRTFGFLPPTDVGRQEQKTTVGVSVGLGATTVAASYALTSTSQAVHDTEHALRALVRSRITDDFTVAHSTVWTRRARLGTTLSDTVDLEAGAALRMGDGLLTGSVAVAHDLAAGRTSDLVFGVKWAGEPTPDLRLAIGTTFHLIDPDDRWGAELDLRYVLGDERVLTTKVTGRARADRPFALVFEVGLAVPLQVPVGRRSDVGRLEGTIARPDGSGLAGAVVTVAGQAVTTTREGTFRFPALPVGAHQVRVVAAGALGANEYFAPDLPAGVLIADDATTELHFVVLEAATVGGRVATETVDADTGRTSIAPDGIADGLARGVRIELRSGDTTLHAVTDATGAFRFARVPAGAWTLHVVLPGVATDYRIEPAEVRLALEPGDHQDVAVRLVPIVRSIQFMDGGTLKPE